MEQDIAQIRKKYNEISNTSRDSSPERLQDNDMMNSSNGITLHLPQNKSMKDVKNSTKSFMKRVESIKHFQTNKSCKKSSQNSSSSKIPKSPKYLSLAEETHKPKTVVSQPPSPSAVSPVHGFQKDIHGMYGNELTVPSFTSDNFLSPNRFSPRKTPTTPRSMRTSPLHFFAAAGAMPFVKELEDSNKEESSSGKSVGVSRFLSRSSFRSSRRIIHKSGKVDDITIFSDSECQQQTQGRKLSVKEFNNKSNVEKKNRSLTRGGSLNLGRGSKKQRGEMRSRSFKGSSKKGHVATTNEAEANYKMKKNPVIKWHGFQEKSEKPHQVIFKKCFSSKNEPKVEGIMFSVMSCGQLQLIRKLALVTLTGYMERYCPTHRSGWNWEFPKFIKKTKIPDYKDKKLFGVPLLVLLQRSGQTLPTVLRAAFRWLQLNALDQIGLFRKPGVKNRILKLKERVENCENIVECMDVFDTQQSYDVADMVKQYLRDLPDSLLTMKMSETFLAIFQHVPLEMQLDAIHCAILLLPDENREVLSALLEFLTLVANNAQYNQMTASNLAVCLAPTLFSTLISNGLASVSSSPRRSKKSAGPDQKELQEAKSSQECIIFMIDNYKEIFTVNPERLSKCNFGYMEESTPVTIELLGRGMFFQNWRDYLQECCNATIKEHMEKKQKNWINVPLYDSSTEISYKKVGDGHPLRLWRCITEVNGHPNEVLSHIINNRAQWDTELLQIQTIQILDERTEIYQYSLDDYLITDFCVLRSWQTLLTEGICILSETSVEHPKARQSCGSVRGVILASRYLIEPAGNNKSRIMHIARVDMKGRSPEWYNKSYGYICAQYLAKIKQNFQTRVDPPEYKLY
ncbi:DLC1 family protein [Megaselia abdita]